MTDATETEQTAAATTEAATTERKDVVPAAYREKYKETGGTCGDFIAVALQKIAKENGNVDVVKSENGIAADRWSTMNPGMQRMNLANVLRGTYLKGGTIKILGKEFNAKHQLEDANFAVEDTPASMAKIVKFLEVQDNDRTITALNKALFPKTTGKTAEQREAEKADKAAAKAKEKADKEATKALDKAGKAFSKANEVATLSETATAEAKTALDAAEEAASAVDEAGRPAAEKAVQAAQLKFDKAKAKSDNLRAKANEANAAVAKLTPAE